MLSGVTENIIVGQPVSLGTGSVELYYIPEESIWWLDGYCKAVEARNQYWEISFWSETNVFSLLKGDAKLVLVAPTVPSHS